MAQQQQQEMSEPVRTAIKRVLGMREEFNLIYTYLSSVRQQVQDSKLTDLSSLVDVAWAVRDILQQCDDLRKECEAIHQLIARVVGMVWAVKADGSTNVKGLLCTGIPKLGQGARLPKRDEPEYLALMKWLGASDKALELDVVRLHFPKLLEVLLNLSEQGKPLPPGIDPRATYPIYGLELRGKTAIDLESLLKQHS